MKQILTLLLLLFTLSLSAQDQKVTKRPKQTTTAVDAAKKKAEAAAKKKAEEAAAAKKKVEAAAKKKAEQEQSRKEREEQARQEQLHREQEEQAHQEQLRREQEERDRLERIRYGNGHDWADLGLSVKWATCNLGANMPEEYGDYYAWGETSVKSNYEWSTYKWCTDSYDAITKYCWGSAFGLVDKKTTLVLSDDAANANWGGSWRMPTVEELDELRENCSWQWTTLNGINGYMVTSKINGKSIFLPVAGARNGTEIREVGSCGFYWSSSLSTSNPSGAFYLQLKSTNASRADYYYRRCEGRSVRAVCP